MAITDEKIITQTYSGKVGKQFILRRRGSKSIIAKKPKKRKRGTTSDVQVLLQEKFNAAVLYAQEARNNPELMAAYAAKRRDNQTAFNVAFLDAYKGPVVSNLRTEGYTGEAGQQILVKAVDNFRVEKVTVQITGADGNILEEGQAQKLSNAVDWMYTTTAANPALTGTLLRISAQDVPMNVTTLEATL